MNIITTEEFFLNTETTPIKQNKKLDEVVLDIITTVQQDGDNALYHYTEEFDGAKLNSLLVTRDEFQEARDLVSEEFIHALNQAKDNITEFHQQQTEKSWFISPRNGITLGQKVTPIEKVGVYVPGGKAAYPSTVLMNVIPARLAGVTSISITTPPDRSGKINPYVLVAASLLGVERVYKVGGAQAIAALAYGTRTVEKVYKIVGPGNSYVARAKKWVYGDVAIDMIAGPSEICVIADHTANPSYVAADLLSQAEHDEDASSICITTSKDLANVINKEVTEQLSCLKRKEIAESSINRNGKIIVAENILEAIDLANIISPEHLQLMVNNPEAKVPYIQNAGAIFLGNYSPEPLGDYLAGPNHTLPTSGTAKFSSPLGVYDFLKRSSIIQYSKENLFDAADEIIQLANTEGLPAHAHSIQVRKDDELA